jgi:superfamily II DNA or RNA helicase
MSSRQRRETGDQFAEVPDGAERLVLATERYIGEGFDECPPRFAVSWMPISWKGTLVQYAGRLQRLQPRKRVVRIVDYVDADVPVVKRMFEKRLRTYRAVGFAGDESPLGYSEPVDEPTIETGKRFVISISLTQRTREEAFRGNRRADPRLRIADLDASSAGD